MKVQLDAHCFSPNAVASFSRRAPADISMASGVDVLASAANEERLPFSVKPIEYFGSARADECLSCGRSKAAGQSRANLRFRAAPCRLSITLASWLQALDACERECPPLAASTKTCPVGVATTDRSQSNRTASSSTLPPVSSSGC